jgi:uncharacterized protein (TIGR02246 family)
MPPLSIEDRLAINDLFVRYTRALDAGDVETMVDCFTEDGWLESPAVGECAGRAAIRAWAQYFAQVRDNGSQLRHVISNMVAQVDGEDGHATCYLITFLTRNGSSRLLAPGQYDCELRKADGAWRFRKRGVKYDHDYDYALAGL